jgi:hypothetical protein
MDIWPLGASPETSTTSATSGVLSSTSDCHEKMLADIFDFWCFPHHRELSIRLRLQLQASTAQLTTRGGKTSKTHHLG